MDFAIDEDTGLLMRLNPPGVHGPVIYAPEGTYTGPPVDILTLTYTPTWRTFFLMDAHRYHESARAMVAQLTGFVWWPTMEANAEAALEEETAAAGDDEDSTTAEGGSTPPTSPPQSLEGGQGEED